MGERPWPSRAHNQRLRSDQIAIAPVAPACPNCRDFVPWRFSDADRPRVGRAQHLGVRETCTKHEVATRQPAARDARAERTVGNRESSVMTGVEPSSCLRSCAGSAAAPRRAAPAPRATESPATRQAVHRTDGLHSQVEPPIILSCCYVSECWFEHDHIPPSALFTL